MGGAAATIVTHPLDMIKTRLALAQPTISTRRPEYANAFDAARRIFTDEGIQRGIYRGLGVSLVGASIYWGTAFALWWRVERLPWTRRAPFVKYEWFLWACGCMTAAIVITHPIDVIRRKHMASNSSTGADRNLIDVIRNIKRQYGLPGYYRGMMANIGKVHILTDDVSSSSILGCTTSRHILYSL